MKNNKGFSLVELIIVIAIMAILVGVMAPQLIRYIDKTNQSSDVQLLDSVRSAVQTALLDPDVVVAGGSIEGSTTLDAIMTDSVIGPEVVLTLGEENEEAVLGRLKSKATDGATEITVNVENGNKVVVSAGRITVGDGDVQIAEE